MVPIDETIRSVETLDFGTVGVGGAKTLSFTITNKSYPHGSQDITVSISGSFTLGAGDDSFTLANYDDTRTIEVTYSPLAVQVDDTSITFTTTATYAMANVAVLAEGRSNTYSLPPIYNNPAGVMKIDLIVDPLVPALTIPETVKVLDIGELTELVDIDPGIVDVQNLTIALAEEYNATYPAGFWYSLIQGYPDYQVQFKFILTEDGTDTFFFWGKVYREDVEWPEHYISTAEDDVIRTVEVKLVSLVHSLKDFAADDAVTEMALHGVNYDIVTDSSTIPDTKETHACVTIKDIIASIVKVCFNQSYDTDDVQVRSSDFRITGTNEPCEDWFIPTANRQTYRGYIEGETDEIKNPLYWPLQFSNCYDLLKAIALNFGWIVRHYYGLADGTYDAVTEANNHHRLELLTRGRAFANFLTPDEGIVESTLVSDTPTKKKNIRVTDLQAGMTQQYNDGVNDCYDTTTPSAWSIDGSENTFYPVFTVLDFDPPILEPPKWAKFDLDISLQFVTGAYVLNGFPDYIQFDSFYRQLFYDGGGGQAVMVCPSLGTMDFWDYQAGDWAAGSAMSAALMAYFNRRFTAGRKQYTRVYGSLKFTDGTTSHVNLKPMKRIQINDQLATENYYATEVRKDFKANRSTVLWIQE